VELHENIIVTEKIFHQGQACVEEFSRVVDYIFQLWTHLQNSPEMNIIEDHIHVSEAQINIKN
jgi:hypothetical protein